MYEEWELMSRNVVGKLYHNHERVTSMLVLILWRYLVWKAFFWREKVMRPTGAPREGPKNKEQVPIQCVG